MAIFLQNEPSPLHTTTIAEKCTENLVAEFEYLRAHAVAPLTTFLDYITYGYMIDNIVLLLTGTMHERDMSELLEKCHPLGFFDAMPSLRVASTFAELYDTVLVDTPLGTWCLNATRLPQSLTSSNPTLQYVASYFKECFHQKEDLNEQNIEIVRNTLYKAYLEDFYRYCQSLGGTTAEVMGDILAFEADRRAINITINAFGTELTKDQREPLYARFGLLYPEGTLRLAKADDVEQVRAIIEAFGDYSHLFEDTRFNTDKSLEDGFFEHEVKLNQLSFDQQMQYGVFYSYVKLKEQEIRNIVWIAECVHQNMKDKINNYVPIFKDY